MSNTRKRNIWSMVAFGLFVIVLPLFMVLASKLGLDKYKEIRVHLKDLGPMPEFKLTDQFGEPYGNTSVNGRLAVASFVFSRCPGQCPKIMSELERIQKELKDKFRDQFVLLTYTIDPDFDTPDVLRNYGSRFNAQPELWYLLTGDKDEIARVVNEGYSLAGDDGDGSIGSITHSAKLALIDSKGTIRNYYDGMNEESVNNLIEDMMLLMPNSKKKGRASQAQK